MKTIIKILLSLILILSISKTKAQMSKWVIGASQWSSSGILNSYQAGNLKFYDVDYSSTNPVVTTRSLGSSITSKKSYGVANVINSITYQNGQIAFYLFMNSPYPINNQTINTDDTLFIVMPNNATGQDEIIGFAGSFTCGRTIQETGICQVPGTTDQYYVILKTSCTSAYLDNIEYVIVNTTSKTISQSYVIVSNKHTNEGIAISKLNSNCSKRWLYFVEDDKAGNLFLRSCQITASGINNLTDLDTLDNSLSPSGGQGEIEISPNGKMLCFVNLTTSGTKAGYLFDIDSITGKTSNSRLITNPLGPCLSAEFSPDSKSLYLVQTGASGYPQQLLHFNIPLNNYSIQNTDVVSGLSSGDIPNLIESASNNKLYLFVNQKSAYMYELSTPNLLTATLSQVSFPSGIIAAAAIPDQVDGEDYSNPCQIQPSFYPCHINGKVYSDSITNCIYDIGEQNISNIKVMLYDNSNLKQQAFTDANGNYTFTVDSVSTYYTIIIDTLNIPFHLTCPISNNLSVHISSVDTIQNNQNFGVVKKTVFDVGVQSISHIGCFQPGYPTTVNIFAGDMISFYSNLNSATGQSGTVKIIKSSLSLYLGASIGALTPLVNGDTLTYTIADFGAVNFTTDFAFDCLTLPSATVEDNICITVIVKSMNPDNNISNDTLKTCFQVVSSFDPNIKEVYPSGETHPNTESLVYTIHFQNTGTASAINIVVIDTLDALHLDLSSIQLIGYSYKPTVQILDGGIAKFTFANINLPDSNANEPASHGYAQFRIKLKKNLPLGTTIHNTAYIYFDFNSPVVTNTTTNILKYYLGFVSPSKNYKVDFVIYPNPTNGLCTIELPKSDNRYSASLLNIVGIETKKLFEDKSLTTFSFNTSALSKGIYFIKIYNNSGYESTQKLIVE